MRYNNSAPYWAAATLCLAATLPAYAGIYLQVTPEAINSTLAANGWSGYLLTLQVDAAGLADGEKIVGLDFANPYRQIIGTPGINGPLQQAWTIDQVNNPGTLIPTPTGSIPVNTAARKDSFFLNTGLYLETENPFTENNNGLNGPNPPYTQSPLTTIPGDPVNGINGVEYGVGSSMTFSGSLLRANYQTSLAIAFVIVPTNYVANPVTIHGVVVDQNIQDFGINTIIAPSIIRSTGPATLFWTGQSSTAPAGDGTSWDFSNHNWNNPANPSAPDTYYDQDAVTFDDAHNLGGQYTVILAPPSSLMPFNPQSIVVNTAGTYTFTGAGSITGSGSLTKMGAGTLILSITNNSYTGGTYLQNGTLQLGADNAVPATGNLYFGDATGNSATLDLAGHNLTVIGVSIVGGSSNLITNSSTTPALITFGANYTPNSTFSGKIQDGLGKISVAVSTILTLTGANTYTGDTTVLSGGTLALGSGGSIVSHNFIINSKAAFNISGGSIPSDANITDDGTLQVSGPSTIKTSTIGSLNGTDPSAKFYAPPNPLMITNGGTYAGSLNANFPIDTIGALTLTGKLVLGPNATLSGNIILAGQATSSAAAVLSSGTLAVNGSLSSTSLTINPGATLGGDGAITGPVTINGILSPGNSPGILSLANPLTCGTASSLAFNVGPTATAGADTDLVHFTTLANNLAGSGLLTLDLVGQLDYSQTYTIFDNVNTPNFTLAGINLSAVTDPTPAFAPLFSFNNTADAYTLTFLPTGVPEPATLPLLALAALPLLRRKPHPAPPTNFTN